MVALAAAAAVLTMVIPATTLAVAPHPRLVASSADFLRVRTLVMQYPEANALLDRTEAVERLGESSAWHHSSEAHRGLADWQSGRNTARRLWDCSLLWRVTENTSWAKCAVDELMQATQGTSLHSRSINFLDWGDRMHGIAIAYDWMYPVLNSHQRGWVASAINQSLASYLSGFATDDPRGQYNASDNWNIVVNGGALLGALSILDEIPSVQHAFDVALAGLRTGFATYGADGDWPEGLVYTQYAATVAQDVLGSLELALGSSLGLAATGADKVGNFILHLIGPTGRFFDFADTDEPCWDYNAYGHGVLLHVANRTSTSAVARAYRFVGRQLAIHYNASIDPSWMRFASELLWFSPEGGTSDLASLSLDAHFRTYSIAVFRSAWTMSAAYIAFKGGTNPDPASYKHAYGHSHLDQGSFVLEMNGTRWGWDLGSDSYELPDYFGLHRFDYYRLNTHGHNCLLFDNQSQVPGSKAPVAMFNTSCCAGTHPCKCAVLDMSASYATAAAAVKRGIIMAGTTIFVVDEIASTNASRMRWQMHTYAQITLHGSGHATLHADGRSLGVVFSLMGQCNEELRTEDINLTAPQKPSPGLRKLVLDTTAGNCSRIVARFSLLDGPPFGASIQPITAWPTMGAFIEHSEAGPMFV